MCERLSNVVSSVVIHVEVFVSRSLSCQSQKCHMTPGEIFLFVYLSAGESWNFNVLVGGLIIITIIFCSYLKQTEKGKNQSFHQGQPRRFQTGIYSAR